MLSLLRCLSRDDRRHIPPGPGWVRGWFTRIILPTGLIKAFPNARSTYVRYGRFHIVLLGFENHAARSVATQLHGTWKRLLDAVSYDFQATECNHADVFALVSRLEMSAGSLARRMRLRTRGRAEQENDGLFYAIGDLVIISHAGGSARAAMSTWHELAHAASKVVVGMNAIETWAVEGYAGHLVGRMRATLEADLCQAAAVIRHDGCRVNLASVTHFREYDLSSAEILPWFRAASIILVDELFRLRDKRPDAWACVRDAVAGTAAPDALTTRIAQVLGEAENRWALSWDCNSLKP